MILEHVDRRIAINPDRFDKLITALITAVDNDGTLNKVHHIMRQNLFISDTHSKYRLED